jgi:hypothetical protein
MMILLDSSYRTINRKRPIVILTIKSYNSMKFYRKLSILNAILKPNGEVSGTTIILTPT